MCYPSSMAKLSKREISEWVGRNARWRFVDDAIRKVYAFPSFRSSIVFVNRVATLADEHDHHPDIIVRYTKVTIVLSTHDHHGVTEKDIKLAERIDFATSAR